ncbi:hypothetical protein H2201_008709 [Coniosporium apollinis]|uniref:HMG box domain-containing protein n=1 Tax=Coniosporium apollinis TaxID=61459 RepID=A0ABQ9NFY7_9PEZI|nr:hypothetical protein H2201_008709 [Coniosporium apollinis]
MEKRGVAVILAGPHSDTAAVTDMASLYGLLKEVGLEQYHDRLAKNGFASWEAVCDISEADLAQLGFKLGHRRILQRAIASHQGHSSTQALGEWVEDGHIAEQSVEFDPEREQEQEPKAKRRYQRRPKPDLDAPVRPKSGHVMFSEHLRDYPAVSALSFVDIAKLVGEEWRALSAEGRQHWEDRSAADVEVYKADLLAYKATPDYQLYQDYLVEFKKWHSGKGEQARKPVGPPGEGSQSRKESR